MRHKDARQRLKQKPAHARMLKRNLLTSLLLYESVRTTQSRAKAVSSMLDRLIRNAKKQEPHNAIRYINSIVTDKNASRKVMDVLVKRYEKRVSGLSSIKPVGARQGDGAKLVDITLIDAEVGSNAPTTKQDKPAKKSTPKTPAATSTAKNEDNKTEAAKSSTKKSDSAESKKS